MADNSTHHRVYLPGPFVNTLPKVVDHGPCQEPEACPVVDGLTTWLATQMETVQPIQVELAMFVVSTPHEDGLGPVMAELSRTMCDLRTDGVLRA